MTDALTPEAFAAALAAPAPPEGWPAPLAALWWAAGGGTAPEEAAWARAHALVQDAPGAEAAWLHAHLHRIEGDPANAAYWYRRAGRPVPQGSIEAERADLVRALAPRP